MSYSRREKTVQYDFNHTDELLTELSQGSAHFLKKLNEMPGIADHLTTAVNFLSHDRVPNFPDKHKLYACYALLCHDINRLNKDQLKSTLKELNDHPAAANGIKNTITALELRLDSENKTFGATDDSLLNLPKADLPGITFTNIQTPYGQLEEANIDNGFLNNFDISHGNLRFLSAKGTTWDGVNVAGADLHGIDLADSGKKKTTMANVSFFTNEEMQDKATFKTALDRWYNMFTKEHPRGDHWYHAVTLKQHPQLKMLREAMVEDINNKISLLNNPQQQVDAYNIAYSHPMFAKHRDLTAVRSFLNVFTVFKAKDGSKQPEAVIPTASQQGLKINTNSAPGQ